MDAVLTFSFWQHVAAVSITGPIILPSLPDLLNVVKRTGIMLCLTFRSGRTKIMYNFGVKRHTNVTVADKLIVTDIDVIRKYRCCAVTKYNGRNANHIIHVVYIVKPVMMAYLRCEICNLISERERQQRTISINWNNWKVFCVWQVFRARSQCNSIKKKEGIEIHTNVFWFVEWFRDFSC